MLNKRNSQALLIGMKVGTTTTASWFDINWCGWRCAWCVGTGSPGNRLWGGLHAGALLKRAVSNTTCKGGGETSRAVLNWQSGALSPLPLIWGFPGCSVVKNPPAMQEAACSAGDTGSIPGSGRSPREGNSNPFQYSCLGNPMDRGAWRASVHSVTESATTEHAHNNALLLDLSVVIS